MAKFDLRFLCDTEDGSYIRVNYNANRDQDDKLIEEWISVKITDCDDITTEVTLDKSTAIKFAKTIRTEINKIDSEVANG